MILLDRDEDRVLPDQHESSSELRQRLSRRGLQPDAEGWKALETSLSALQHLVALAPDECSEESLSLIRRSCTHRNRFVRQAAYYCLSPLAAHHLDVAPSLALGLADNWSQVRLAASVATRAFVTSIVAEADAAAGGVGCGVPDERRFALLVPGMCLNRYYVAEGVRVYSLDTWRLVAQRVPGGGPALLARHAAATVDYYVAQARADNHAVREAACYCMAELATKVGGDAVRPHVATLLDAMLDCFRDESWPVRDAACVALGDFVGAFPDKARPKLPELENLWVQHLADNIATVRRNSAAALGKAMGVYGDELTQRMSKVVGEWLPEALKQPPSSRRVNRSMRNTSEFGVCASNEPSADAERERVERAHTDQVMYSCGSLAPKLRRGGGCMDHGFVRAREPWESSDGAAHLLAELAVHAPALAEQHIPALVELLGVSSFAQHGLLKEAIFKDLFRFAQALGKRVFKRHLGEFAESLVRALEDSENRLAQYAAAHVIEQLVAWLSRTMFMFRLSEEQQRIIERSPLVNLDACLPSPLSTPTCTMASSHTSALPRNSARPM